MFCIFIDRVCVVTGENKLCFVCVLTKGALEQGRVIYVLYKPQRKRVWVCTNGSRINRGLMKNV